MTHPHFEYQQALITPFTWRTNLNDDGVPVPNVEKLTWHLRGDGARLYYVCMNGLARNLREVECSTPEFYAKSNALPYYVTDYMNRFAQVWMAGAAWGRANFSKPCPEIPF